jgi:lipopolysaccharide biosynthesis glycosyltransferase
MKKAAIFTVSTGAIRSLTEPFVAMERYSERCGADFIRLRHSVVGFHSDYFEKMYFVELLETYERVLYLDADILITPHAADIFSVYDDPGRMYAFNENLPTEAMNRDQYVTPLLNACPQWPLGANGRLRYFNSGVLLISQAQRDAFKDFREPPPGLEVIDEWFPDQTYLNYLAVKSNVPFGEIDYSFNRMHMGERDPKGERFAAHFIHYAGPDTYGEGDKAATIRDDFARLYCRGGVE